MAKLPTTTAVDYAADIAVLMAALGQKEGEMADLQAQLLAKQAEMPTLILAEGKIVLQIAASGEPIINSDELTTKDRSSLVEYLKAAYPSV